ncbi:ATP-binding protein [Bradyrhizobium sp. CER78]|uniref:sensor histidine kinase n=1 Tax=Bradyrhizobium sp. CER78 TaxID=3039162 RepID=UPI00244853EA|nr:ATP-binding protein [Bradyrhizobium sp. CER78]MDH2386453.1 ATP-binding protein [Bradyrhizobium sp. CER78]
MNQLKTGEAPEAAHGSLDLQEELAEVLRQRAAISAVLRAIASSPHDLQPIFDTILDNAVHLCRSEGGLCRLTEEIGFRLVAYKRCPGASDVPLPPKLLEYGSFLGRLVGSRSPVHIPDLATHHELSSAGEAEREYVSNSAARTTLIVPMLRNDELIGTLGLARRRIEPFTEKEIELVTDFAAQATIALDITRRERELRELQIELARANRIATIEQLSSSIAHEVIQPIATARNNARAGLRFLELSPPNLSEAREAFDGVVAEADRAGDIIRRIRDHIKKAPPKMDRFDVNEAIRNAIILTRGEVVKIGASIQAELAEPLPFIRGDRVQIQQVIVNLIVNAVQAMSGDGHNRRELQISTETDEAEGVRVGVRDTGPGLAPESVPRLFEPFYTTKAEGMGVGLAICRSIVEAHGGRLWATACEPHGTLFQFTIPAEQDATS